MLQFHVIEVEVIVTAGVEGDAAMAPGHPSPSGSMHRWFPACGYRASDQRFKKAI
jgi:hypothetical protein